MLCMLLFIASEARPPAGIASSFKEHGYVVLPNFFFSLELTLIRKLIHSSLDVLPWERSIPRFAWLVTRIVEATTKMAPRAPSSVPGALGLCLLCVCSCERTRFERIARRLAGSDLAGFAGSGITMKERSVTSLRRGPPLPSKPDYPSTGLLS